MPPQHATGLVQPLRAFADDYLRSSNHINSAIIRETIRQNPYHFRPLIAQALVSIMDEQERCAQLGITLLPDNLFAQEQDSIERTWASLDMSGLRFFLTNYQTEKSAYKQGYTPQPEGYYTEFENRQHSNINRIAPYAHAVLAEIEALAAYLSTHNNPVTAMIRRTIADRPSIFRKHITPTATEIDLLAFHVERKPESERSDDEKAILSTHTYLCSVWRQLDKTGFHEFACQQAIVKEKIAKMEFLPFQLLEELKSRGLPSNPKDAVNIFGIAGVRKECEDILNLERLKYEQTLAQNHVAGRTLLGFWQAVEAYAAYWHACEATSYHRNKTPYDIWWSKYSQQEQELRLGSQEEETRAQKIAEMEAVMIIESKYKLTPKEVERIVKSARQSEKTWGVSTGYLPNSNAAIFNTLMHNEDYIRQITNEGVRRGMYKTIGSDPSLPRLDRKVSDKILTVIAATREHSFEAIGIVAERANRALDDGFPIVLQGEQIQFIMRIKDRFYSISLSEVERILGIEGHRGLALQRLEKIAISPQPTQALLPQKQNITPPLP